MDMWAGDGCLNVESFSPFFFLLAEGKLLLGLVVFHPALSTRPRQRAHCVAFCVILLQWRGRNVRTFLTQCVNDFSMLRSPTVTFALIKPHYFNIFRTHASMSSSSLSLLGGILTASPLVMTLMSHLR